MTITQEEVETLLTATNAGSVARVHLPTDPEDETGLRFRNDWTCQMGPRERIEGFAGAGLRGSPSS